MQARGFVIGIRRHLSGLRPGPEAYSAAIGFKTARAAQRDVAATIADARSGMSLITPVPVKGIPGARAVAIANAESKGYVIVFADDLFLHHLTVLYPRDTAKPLSFERVLAGALALYRRVHTH